ncbi:MAG: hypothetical protein GY858_04350 [Candidatus Omnitrophica bacterium]|nr:hypothetical protein [Candidatus Omnitrophota bacterium]
METIKLRAKGTAPLLMHSNKSANPLSIYAKTMKPLTSKRNKTDADFAEIARIEWEAGLYLEKGLVVMPGMNIDKCLLLGARKTKDGKKYEMGVFLEEDFCHLSYKGKTISVKKNGVFPNDELDKYYEDFKHQQMVKVGSSQVLRTRPIFHDWSFEFTLMYDENIIDERTILTLAKNAGRMVGLCEIRPRLGRFDIEVV